jgi:hypothetical protein
LNKANLINPLAGQLPSVAPGLSNDENVDSATQVLVDYYRCPKEFLRFLPPGKTFKRRGYFRLGADTPCYGRLSFANAAVDLDHELEDALPHVEVVGADVRLPFDAIEIVENLRRERYSAHFREEGHFLNSFLRKAYYLLRPHLSVPVRRHLQKIRLRDWEKIPFPAWPVDWTVDRIHQKLLALTMRSQGLEKVPFVWFWPDNHRACVIITHDVEGSLGRDFCGQLMDVDESFGFRSSFQIVPENRYPVSKSYLDSLASRGFEVNVHDLKHDGRLYADHGEFLRRAERINRYVQDFGAEGFRSGILYRNADWFEAFKFSYDMSIPNVAHLDPQRGGCCSIMPYFIGRIVELPVTCAQDYTLFNILEDYSIELWKKQVASILANHGLISVIVHPDYVRETRPQNTYKAFLSHLADLRAKGGVWTPLPREVAAWWRARSKMSLAFKDGKWVVEGEGKERARVAYASVAGEEEAYSLEA